MRLNYSIITSVLILILLLLLLSSGVQAQTASSKPIASVLTPLIREHLARKAPQEPVQGSSNQLPSAKEVPAVATEAKQQYAHAGGGRPQRVPSSARPNVAQILERNSLRRFDATQK